MARHKRKLVVLKEQDTITLGTLANNTVIKQANTYEITEDFFVLSVDTLATIRDATAGEVPIILGWADDNLSVAEIAEAIDATPAGPNDIIQMERTRRPVRLIGQFTSPDTHTELANGDMIRTKIRRSVASGRGMTFWAQNKSGATLTTGASITFTNKYYGYWQR